MRILPKILLTFLALTIFSLAQSFFGVWSLNSVTSSITATSSNPVRQVDAARSAWNFYQQASIFLDSKLQAYERLDQKNIVQQFGTLADKMDNSVRAYLGSSPSPSGKILAEKTVHDFTIWKTWALELIGGDPQTSIHSPQALAKRQEKLRAQLDDLVSIALADEKTSKSEIETLASHSILTSSIMALLGIIAGVAFAVPLGYRVVKPLIGIERRIRSLMNGDTDSSIEGVSRKDEIGGIARAISFFKDRMVQKQADDLRFMEQQKAAEISKIQAEAVAIERERLMVRESFGSGLVKLAGRDLTYRMKFDLPESYKKLQLDFNSALAQLESVISSVSASTEKITSGTREISSASVNLSIRTQSQAANLEETAATITDLTSRVNEAAAGALQAREFVEGTKVETAKSSNVMEKATQAMNRIEVSSQKMTRIIDTIEEIAFQTNLLALNAGVEAARAGDAGRGFAVVASEVRSLAQRSTESAKEIKSLIQNSLGEISQGVKLVDATRTSLNDITERVSKINGVMRTIADTSEEQAMGLKNISSAINQMDETTQLNAAMVEESSEATRSLAEQSIDLNTMINSFVIGAKSVLTRSTEVQTVPLLQKSIS